MGGLNGAYAGSPDPEKWGHVKGVGRDTGGGVPCTSYLHNGQSPDWHQGFSTRK